MNAEMFLDAARVAEDLIRHRAVVARWAEPSALEGYTVGGLAGHLARAVLTVDRYLGEPVPAIEPTDAAGYLVRVLGNHPPVDSAFHLAARERGMQEAAEGPERLATRLREARLDLVDRLAAIEAGRLVAVLDGVVLPIEQYLETRLVELVVHLDDLAVSVDLGEPDEIPEAAYERVAVVLARVAARREDPLALVRSLARAERHPDAVRAL